MGKGKLKKWRENAQLANVHEPELQQAIDGQEYMKGEWHEKVFHNQNPITLELGCGKGEYTVELAKRYPNRNFIGVDIKGHRFWKGAKESNQIGLPNVAFLRTRIEFIANFFARDEVEEIWLTFSDPQPKDDKGSKRLTSPKFMDRYRKFIKSGGIVNVKTDSDLLFEYTVEALGESGIEFELLSRDVYGDLVNRVDEEMKDILNIRTHYEQIWMEKGEKINFLKFRL